MTTYAVVTFGCQMNQHDSERIGEVLERAGYRAMPEPGRADVIVVNTCSVRDKAEHKLRSELGRLALLKRRRPELVLAVAGCVAQQEGERLLAAMPQVDVVIGPDNIAELPGLLSEVEQGAVPRARTTFDVEEPRFLPASPRAPATSPTAFVTVMKGCDERCSFCIVPTTRGPERYRASCEVIAEVRRLVAAGVREVTLLGQTVNSYRDPERALVPAPGGDDETEFPALLRAICEQVPGLVRLRYTSPHPRHLTASLVRAHAELPVLARHVHLPVQSGSDRVLKRMIRRYSVAEYLRRVQMLRDEVVDVTLSTDVIVGFPGETCGDFEATLELVRRVGFVGVFGFKYSRRPFTPALRLVDDVSEEDKSARLAELFEVSGALQRAHLSSLVGTLQSVLVEGRGKSGACTGRTHRNEIVHFDSARDRTGELVDVRITDSFKHSLGGRVRDDASTELAPQPRSDGARRALPVV